MPITKWFSWRFFLAIRCRLSLFSFVFIFGSCSQGSRSPIASYQIIGPGLKLGEYLQVDSDHHFITVNRSPDSDLKGIVRLNPKTLAMDVLDPQGSEAMELKVAGDRLVYRIDKAIYGLNLNGGGPTLIMDQISQLSTYSQSGRLCYLDAKSIPHWLLLDDHFLILNQGILPGPARLSLKLEDQSEGIVLRAPDGLFLAEWGDRTEGIKSEELLDYQSLGNFASARILHSKLFIFYLNDDSGMLKMATRNSAHSPFSHSTVDGTPDQTYRGMDIAIFNDHGNPGVFYLDAWQYKLRMAKFRDGIWQSQELPIQGAVGFYTQVVSESDERVQIGFRNFRTHYEDGHETFGNLGMAEILIDPN